MPDFPRLPAPDTLGHLLLTLTAISGEYPSALVSRLPGGASYKENVVKQLKREKLLRTFYRDGLRGLRLTALAKSLLMQEQPDAFRPYLTGSTETNALKSEVPRRLRLYRMAEVLTAMFNAGVLVFGWEKAPVFTNVSDPPIPLPAYYSSRELKELGPLAVKVRGSRAAGVLLTDDSIFAVYNTGPSLMKWEYRAEMRLKALLQIELCNRRLATLYRNAPIQGLVLGSGMECLPGLMCNTPELRHNYFVLDGNFDAFYFLTNDHRGEVILRLLCDPELQATLDTILCENLLPRRNGFPVEHDALDDDGAPVLLAYTCDMPRIRRFDTALELHDRSGTLICFDHQEAALRQVCGTHVQFQCIDFEKFERSVCHIKKDVDQSRSHRFTRSGRAFLR